MEFTTTTDYDMKTPDRHGQSPAENRKEKEEPPRPYLWMDRGPSGNLPSPSSGGQLLFH